MSIPAGTPALSGGRPARLTRHLKPHGPKVQYSVSQGLLTGCVICNQQGELSKCAGCRMVRYCNSEHQKRDWRSHKPTCTAIKTLRKEVLKEEVVMCAMGGVEIIEEHGSKGLFWTDAETREYMQARWKLAEELMKTNTNLAVEAALAHLLEMNHLCRADNQGVRWLIPALMIRLRQDRECYDYLKWWATKGDYNFNDTSLPFLEKKNQDAYEPVTGICEDMFLNHLVALALLKIRLLLDLQILRSARTSALNIPDFPLLKLCQNFHNNAISSATRTDISFVTEDPTATITNLEKQVRQLYEQVQEANPHFWPALLKPGDHLNARPSYYTFGGEGEMQYALQYNYNSWVETPGAIDVIGELSKKA